MTTEQFNKLKKSERCILIAEDVIKSIKKGIFISNHSYCRIALAGRNTHESTGGMDAQQVLEDKKIVRKCEGCARGALFISTVKFKNILTLGEVKNSNFQYNAMGDTSATNYLNEDFSKEQQSLIESAYEAGHFTVPIKDMTTSFDTYREKISKAMKFRGNNEERWRAAKKRAAAKGKKYYKFNDWILMEICKNIIENKGTFKP